MAAQDTRVYLDAGFSHARPPSEVEADPSTYVQMGGRVISGPIFGALFGGLALTDSAADWIGGTLATYLSSTGFREPGFGLTALVSAFSVGQPSRYDAISARIVPELYLPLSGPTATLRAYGGIGQSEVDDLTVEPAGSVVSDLWMYGAGGEVGGSIQNTRLWAGLEAYDTDGGTFVAAYAGSSGRLERMTWSAALKVWDTPADVEVQFDLSFSLPIGHAWSVQASGGRSGPDPLLGTPAAVDGSVSFTWDVLAPIEPPRPVFTIVAGETPTVRFRMESEGASEVSVVGDFSNWEPVAMRQVGDSWVAELEVKPGLYHFGFLVDGEWHVPEHAPGKVADDFGRTNATLVVPVSDFRGP